MARWIAIALAALLAALWGCLDHDNFGLGRNQGNTDDDDFGGDDDTWVGDDDFTPLPPGDWETIKVEVNFDTTGATDGGDGNTYVALDYMDEDQDYICGRQLKYRSTYTYGQNQGDQIFQYADEVLTFNSGEETGGNCPADYDVSADELMTMLEWKLHPLIFVSCDSVDADPTLAAMPVTLEEFIWEGEWGDGTFEFFCAKIGPAAVYFFHTGPHEGVWLRPGHPGDLDEYAEFNYFEPVDSTNVDVWMFYGFSVAEEYNESEPIEGLAGEYRIVPLWEWILTRDDL